MNKNIIYYFSGTGNCLQAAKAIAATIPNCEIWSMGRKHETICHTTYERIGFVYPTYFVGLPLAVERFVRDLDLSKNHSAYIFVITTYGETAGNGLSQLAESLQEKKAQLDYGEKLKMFSNYVAWYKMGDKKEEKAEQAARHLLPMIKAIKEKQRNKVNRPNPLITWYHQHMVKQVPTKDRAFTVASSCISCGKCEQICPVKNIQLINDKPTFSHRCEQCMACIQYCPKEALNYKNKTQNRGRYTNPTTTFQELAAYNGG